MNANSLAKMLSSNNILILGNHGSGKSFLLQKIYYAAKKQYIRAIYLDELGDERSKQMLEKALSKTPSQQIVATAGIPVELGDYLDSFRVKIYLKLKTAKFNIKNAINKYSCETIQKIEGLKRFQGLYVLEDDQRKDVATARISLWMPALRERLFSLILGDKKWQKYLREHDYPNPKIKNIYVHYREKLEISRQPAKKTSKQKFPKELENLLHRSYLIEIYTKYWEDLFNNPSPLQDCLSDKLSSLERAVRDICKEIETENIGLAKDIVNDGIDIAFKEHKRQIGLLPVLSGFDFSIEMAKFLTRKIMLEGIERELQSLGVEVIKLTTEEVKFIDKETKIVLNDSFKSTLTAPLWED